MTQAVGSRMMNGTTARRVRTVSVVSWTVVWYSRVPMLVMTRVSGFLVTMMAVTAVVRAAEPQPPPAITVSAEAVITAEPDRAEIEVGVVTEAKTAQAAADENARKLSATIAKLRALVGPAGRIQTADYSLQPIYSRTKVGPPVLTGYSATNSVRVTLDDLKLVGRVVDAAVDSGANIVYRLAFTLKDDREAYNQALAQAAADARAEAETIAAALRLKIVRVLRVEEMPGEVRPMLRRGAEVMMQAETPIEAGPLDIRASVTLTVEVAP